MAVFLTGATGYLGSYLAAGLLRAGDRVNVLVRSHGTREGERRLWRSLQLHFDFPEFEQRLHDQVRIFAGDVTLPDFGLAPDAHERLLDSTESVIHAAASLNRRSERKCVDVNFRGTLAMLRFAQAVRVRGALRRFTFLSTVAVAGVRSHETVTEDGAVDWQRRDYDPYARTKKMAEHLARELLTNAPFTIVRPSVVLGDSERPETTQFDMVRAFSFLASAPLLPFRPSDRIDVAPVNWVTSRILALHRTERPVHDTYHLSAGEKSPTYREITDTIAAALDRSPPLFVPVLEAPTAAACAALARFAPDSLRRDAALLGVFLPYLTQDTVYDSERVVHETGSAPDPFPEWGIALLQWSRRHRFRYPYQPWPGEPTTGPAASGARPAGSLAS